MGPCQMACMTPGALSSRPPCRTRPGDPRGCRPLTGPGALAWSGRGHCFSLRGVQLLKYEGPFIEVLMLGSPRRGKA